MKTYKVIKKEGVRLLDGSLAKKDKTFKASPRSASIQLQLKCKEIKEVKAELAKLNVKFDDKTSEEELRKLLEEATKKKS